MRSVVVLTPLLLLAAAGAGLAAETSAAAAAAPPASPEALAASLAQLPAQLTGWTLAAPPGSWLPVGSGQRLGTQAADLRDYRFLWGAYASLTAGGEVAVSVDVLYFASPLDAFGVYSRRLAGATRQAQLGAAAFWEGRTLRVWQGDYYLVITGTPPETRTDKLMLQVAQVLADRLPHAAQEPLLLRLMPRARMVNYSLRYFWRQMGNLPPFRQALTAEYDGAQGPVQLMLAEAGSEAEARQFYQQLRSLLDTGGEARPLPGIGDRVDLVVSNERGLCFLLQDGAFVVTAMRIGDRPLAEALLRLALTNIHTVRP